MAEKQRHKQWKDQDIISAMNAVNKIKSRQYAAAIFGVPRKTVLLKFSDVCHSTEPEHRLVTQEFLRIDCDVCGVWVYSYCAFKKNINVCVQSVQSDFLLSAKS